MICSEMGRTPKVATPWLSSVRKQRKMACHHERAVRASCSMQSCFYHILEAGVPVPLLQLAGVGAPGVNGGNGQVRCGLLGLSDAHEIKHFGLAACYFHTWGFKVKSFHPKSRWEFFFTHFYFELLPLSLPNIILNQWRCLDRCSRFYLRLANRSP